MTELVSALDAYGDPILLAVGAPRADKTGGSVAVNTKSGNPFHDPGSGTFGNGPAGAKVLGDGGQILKQLTPAAALYLTQLRNKTGATEISVTENKGRANITLLKNGVKVATADLPIPAGGPAPQAEPGAPAALVVTGDAARAKARENVEMGKLDGQSRAQRVNDLVDYLYARYNSSGAIFAKPGTVRVEAPAGWDKKTIGGLTDTELKDVAQRLAKFSWSQDALKKVLLPHIKAGRRNTILNIAKETT